MYMKSDHCRTVFACIFCFVIFSQCLCHSAAGTDGLISCVAVLLDLHLSHTKGIGGIIDQVYTGSGKDPVPICNISHFRRYIGIAVFCLCPMTVACKFCLVIITGSTALIHPQLEFHLDLFPLCIQGKVIGNCSIHLSGRTSCTLRIVVPASEIIAFTESILKQKLLIRSCGCIVFRIVIFHQLFICIQKDSLWIQHICNGYQMGTKHGLI